MFLSSEKRGGHQVPTKKFCPGLPSSRLLGKDGGLLTRGQTQSQGSFSLWLLLNPGLVSPKTSPLGDGLDQSTHLIGDRR